MNLKVMTVSLQNATLVAFSPIGRDDDSIGELGDFLTNSQLMKIIFLSLLISAE